MAIPIAAGYASTPRIDGDLRLVYDRGVVDLVQDPDTEDLVSDPGLETAIILSLFLDARAPDAVELREEDRRGWVGDAMDGEREGSLLWLLERSTPTDQALSDAERYCRAALAWMLEDRVCERVDVRVTRSGKESVQIEIDPVRPGESKASFRFDYNWKSQILRHTEASAE